MPQKGTDRLVSAAKGERHISPSGCDILGTFRYDVKRTNLPYV